MSTDLTLRIQNLNPETIIHLPVSKSECNRAQIISYLSGKKVTVQNFSDAKDSITLNDLLSIISDEKINYLNCGPAGTTFRFILAVAAISPGSWFLTGNERMNERPVGILVDALRSLGAEIEYTGKPGFPPLKISGRKLHGGQIGMDASVSSQFVSSLMMIAPLIENGLEIRFTAKPVSFPYLRMTAGMMNHCGAVVNLEENKVKISPVYYGTATIVCEQDWSAASYFYSIAAVNKNLKIHLPGLKKESLQGDAIVQHLYALFGVETTFTSTGITISNNNAVATDYLEYDFSDCPDLAQTVAFTCAALGIEGNLTGLSTLKNKETDRITALETELTRCGMQCKAGTDSISFYPEHKIPEKIAFETYDDHRMAMASSVMVFVCDEITIKNEQTVEKSFPDFWKELKKIL